MKTHFCLRASLFLALLLALVLCFSASAYAALPPPSTSGNGFWAEANGPTAFTVSYGSQVTLRVNAGCNQGSLHYHWVSEMRPELPDVDSSSFTFSVTTRDWIGCQVSDDFDNSEWIFFDVTVDNGLAVDTGGYKYIPVKVPYGETTVLEAKASCRNGTLNYYWRSDNYYDLQSVNSPRFTTLPVTGKTYYFCDISDEYGNTVVAPFEVLVDNQLTVNPSDDVEVTVPPGKNTFSVEAACLRGELHYYWNGNETGSNSYTFENLTANTSLRCIVEDDYGNWESVLFTIVVDEHFDNHFEVEAVGRTSVSVAPYGSVILQVQASCLRGNLHYQWRTWDGIIENETSDTYQITNITSFQHPFCTVEDDYGNSANIYFYVSVDNNFSVRSLSSTNVMTAPNSSASFQVSASCSIGELHYQWYGPNGMIPGAESDSYTVNNVLTYQSFYCSVNDDFGNAENIYYYVSVDNQFTVKAVGTGIIYVAPNDSATLQVRASCTSGQLHYQWYKSGHIITDAVSDNLLVTNIQSSKEYYYCRVNDDYGNSDNIYFTIYVDNAFSASASGNREIHTALHSSVTLQVRASCSQGDLHFYWYGPNGRIAGAESESYTIADVTRSGSYECSVSDDYGNSYYIYFRVYVENQFTAEAVGSQNIYAALNSSVALQVRAFCDQGELHYQWSGPNGVISYANGDSYTVPRVTTNQYYYCNVSDDYGNAKTLSFSIFVDNQFTAVVDGPSRIVVPLNGSAVLRVKASCAQGDLHYHWYGLNDTFGNDTNTLHIPNVMNTQVYYCCVSDDYDNSTTLLFSVYVENGFSAYAVSDEDLYVPKNSSVQLQVSASCTEGAIHYNWSNSNLNPVGDTQSDSYTVTGITRSQTYYCDVCDDYGNTRSFRFNIHVGGLKVMPVGSRVIPAQYGDTVRLQVDVQYEEDVPVIQWYRRMEAYGDMWYEPVEGEADTVLTVDVEEKLAIYSCEVSDDKDYFEISFMVLVPDFTLPFGLTAIESEAFAGIYNAIVWVPSSVTEIADNAFEKSVYVFGEPGSYAEQYAGQHNCNSYDGLQEY